MQIRVFVLFMLLFTACSGPSGDTNVSVTLNPVIAERRVDILFDGNLFTSYCWPVDVYKPVLYPVISTSGKEVTRGYPLKPRTGEQTDHIHQVGIWLNYGNVNGLDFWGNGYRGMKEPKGGEIRHRAIEKMQSKKGEGVLDVSADWITPAGKILLTERTQYHFFSKGSSKFIDRITTLTAGDTSVLFSDTKEGMFGMRVARQLELPSKSGVILIDSTGNPSKTKDTLNIGVSGNYLSSEGVRGDAVWGTRARWMNLHGMIDNEEVAITVCDHPKNPGYPTYWHARGYGLFAANPLGWKDFTKGNEEFNFSLKEGKKATFRYRVIISSAGTPSPEELNSMADDFAEKYR